MIVQFVPAWVPDARTRLLLRIGAVIGAVIFALWIPAFVSADFGGVEISATRPYTWHDESAVFLHNSFSHPTTCTVVPATGDRRSFDLSARSYTTNVAINGVHLDRWFSGNATVTCQDPGVYLSKGPLLWIYPVGADAAIPFGGFLLLFAWWTLGRRKLPSDSR